MPAAAARTTSTSPATMSPTILRASGIRRRSSSVLRASTIDLVKLCYALRRGVYYPSQRDEFGEMPPRAERRTYLPLVRSMGFDAVEVGVDESADEQSATAFRNELRDEGLDIGCVRAGGALHSALTGPRAR